MVEVQPPTGKVDDNTIIIQLNRLCCPANKTGLNTHQYFQQVAKVTNPAIPYRIKFRGT